MNALIVTFHRVINYGALLQAYALQRYLSESNVNSEVLDYVDVDDNIKSIGIKQILINYIFKFLELLYFADTRKLKKSFEDFHNNRMNISRLYLSPKDVAENAPHYDLLITGSDQVWNLSLYPSYIPIRFLDFGDTNSIRISYAASIGRLNYSDSEKKLVNMYLDKFQRISLREKSACDYIKTFSSCDAINILDPVFLLPKNEWEKIAIKPNLKEKYILCYFIQGNPRIKEVLSTIKKETGYKIVSINNTPVKHCKADVQLNSVSPEEFLGWYSNASIVVTTSFHGTAFGLIFQKPTYALVRKNQEKRIEDLMKDENLSKFVVHPDTEVSIMHTLSDYHPGFDKLLKESKEYIDSIIKIVSNYEN